MLGNLILSEESCVQTGLEEEGEKLSEVASSSDRFSGETGKAVRSSPEFGQVLRQKEKSCLK
ncbi:hypothetical protein J7E32_00940 [Bacillus sp. ISL-55]|nr:hypothetical protein [Bacillus sp. ISL-55]